MALFLDIHPDNPQLRLIRKVTEALKSGAVIAYPTDSGYALGCALGNKNAMDRIIKIRELKRHHHFTLMLKDLSHVGEYAKLNNSGFRLLKKIGVRVSSNAIVQSILEDLMEPIMSVSLIMKGYEFYHGNDVKTVLNNSIDLIIDSGHCPPEPTTVINISENDVVILREGAGSLEFVN
jgi:tRNA A37 threonylcarbamoyladenosine synthetase subunit TsaC/SUA5/YrdC